MNREDLCKFRYKCQNFGAVRALPQFLRIPGSQRVNTHVQLYAFQSRACKRGLRLGKIHLLPLEYSLRHQDRNFSATMPCLFLQSSQFYQRFYITKVPPAAYKTNIRNQFFVNNILSYYETNTFYSLCDTKNYSSYIISIVKKMILLPNQSKLYPWSHYFNLLVGLWEIL